MTKLGLAILTCWGLGTFLVIYNAGLLALRRWRLKTMFVGKEEEPLSYHFVGSKKRWKQYRVYLEDKNSLAGTNWSFNTFLAYTIILGLLGALVGIKYLANLTAAIPLAVGFGMIPWAYVSYFITKKQELMADQLVPAVQYFVSEYGSLPNVIAALNNTIPRISYPLSAEVERLIMELNSGQDKEKALFAFAHRVNNHWAIRFAHILNFKLSKGIDINPPLLNLYMDMKTKKLKEKERGMESVGVKLESYALYLFTPIMYLLGSKINPQSHYLLTQTPEGKKVMLVIVLLAVGGVIAMTKMNNNKVR